MLTFYPTAPFLIRLPPAVPGRAATDGPSLGPPYSCGRSKRSSQVSCFCRARPWLCWPFVEWTNKRKISASPPLSLNCLSECVCMCVCVYVYFYYREKTSSIWWFTWQIAAGLLMGQVEARSPCDRGPVALAGSWIGRGGGMGLNWYQHTDPSYFPCFLTFMQMLSVHASRENAKYIYIKMWFQVKSEPVTSISRL